MTLTSTGVPTIAPVDGERRTLKIALLTMFEPWAGQLDGHGVVGRIWSRNQTEK